MTEFFLWLRNILQVRRLFNEQRRQGTSSGVTIAKLVLGMVLYGIMPFDLIPDFIPVIGELDDAVVITILLGIAGIIYWRSRGQEEVIHDLPQTSQH